MKLIIVYLLGLTLGFLLCRFFAKRGKGTMKLCNDCEYKQTCVQLEKERLDNEYFSRLVTPNETEL